MSEGGFAIVAGFGFRSAAGLASLRCALARHGVVSVTHLVTVQDKVEALAPLAREMGLPLIGIRAEVLAATATPTASDASRRARGTGSVAEAAALAAVVGEGRLLHLRRISKDRMATCAIAQGNIA